MPEEIKLQRLFPHYTWGYIVLFAYCICIGLVPSLYVRVYRLKNPQFVIYTSSLTIREGISDWIPLDYRFYMFPHYTWGYIAENNAATCGRSVPSLYVRVYRIMASGAYRDSGSLTIREGISKRNAKKKTQKLRSLIICEGILVIFASFRIPHIKNVKIFQKNTKKGSQKYE